MLCLEPGFKLQVTPALFMRASLAGCHKKLTWASIRAAGGANRQAFFHLCFRSENFFPLHSGFYDTLQSGDGIARQPGPGRHLMWQRPCGVPKAESIFPPNLSKSIIRHVHYAGGFIEEGPHGVQIAIFAPIGAFKKTSPGERFHGYSSPLPHPDRVPGHVKSAPDVLHRLDPNPAQGAAPLERYGTFIT